MSDCCATNLKPPQLNPREKDEVQLNNGFIVFLWGRGLVTLGNTYDLIGYYLLEMHNFKIIPLTPIIKPNCYFSVSSVQTTFHRKQHQREIFKESIIILF